MARALKYEFVGLDELSTDLSKVIKAYPDIAFKIITQAGNAFKKDAKNKTQSVTKTHTGNLAKGYRSNVKMNLTGSKTCQAEISGGNGKAHHFHLLENGHKGVAGFGRNRRDIGFVPGRHMVRDTRENWDNSNKLESYAVKALTKGLKEGGF